MSILEPADQAPPPSNTVSLFFHCIMFSQSHPAKLVFPVVRQHRHESSSTSQRIKLTSKESSTQEPRGEQSTPKTRHQAEVELFHLSV